MTIVTKPLSEKKTDKPLVEDGGIPAEVSRGQGVPLVRTADPRALYRARKAQSASTACLFVTALIVLSCGIVTGLCLYKQFVRVQMEKFHMRCNIPMSQARQGDQDMDHSLENDMMMPDGGAMLRGDSLQEDFEIDDNYEKIVPIFSGGRRSKFVHDFKTNKTGIVDVGGGRCFVMPLNRTTVLPPDTLMDLIEKLNEGYYEVDTSYVRHNMQVVLPAIEDRSGLGPYIEKECFGVPIYKLEKITSRVFKRSAEPGAKFLEFAGKKTQELLILNYKQLEEHEDQMPVAMA